MKTCTDRLCRKCTLFEVGVGQILKMRMPKFRVVDKNCVKSLMSTQKTYIGLINRWGEDWSNDTTKLGLETLDAGGPTLK